MKNLEWKRYHKAIIDKKGLPPNEAISAGYGNVQEI